MAVTVQNKSWCTFLIIILKKVMWQNRTKKTQCNARVTFKTSGLLTSPHIGGKWAFTVQISIYAWYDFFPTSIYLSAPCLVEIFTAHHLFLCAHIHTHKTCMFVNVLHLFVLGFKSCDAATGNCTCLPGVGGTLCDRCLPHFWGMQNIKYGSNGCTRKYKNGREFVYICDLEIPKSQFWRSN